jgi:hypothetical protein
MQKELKFSAEMFWKQWQRADFVLPQVFQIEEKNISFAAQRKKTFFSIKNNERFHKSLFSQNSLKINYPINM